MSDDLTKVLIIEDNDLFRKSLANVINKSSKMKCAGSYISAEDALKDIEQKELKPEVVLMDIGLPGITGVECISYIKDLSRETKIIMLTIHDDDDNIFKAVCSGAAGYLLKDMHPGKIIESIEEVLNGGAPMNSNIAKKVLDLFKNMTAPVASYDLTDRENEILKLLVDGLSKKQIAQKIFLSYHTVDVHIRHIYEKLEVHTLSGAVAKALKERLL
ncbi:MAG: response regulator transcription factor [Bacteroidetes bacterium]|nr:response regulator transcription factor [Bacteroidota bacterium]